MPNSSPGKQSRNAFSIGNDTSDDEHFVVDETKTPLAPKRSDPLNSLVRTASEEKPLIIPVPPTVREESTPPPDHERHLVVNVFTLDEEQTTWNHASRFARYEEDSEGFDHHLGKPHVPVLRMDAFENLKKLTPKTILLPNVEFVNVETLCETLVEKIEDPDVPDLADHLVQLLQTQKESVENEEKLNRTSSTQSLHPNDAVAPITTVKSPKFPRVGQSAPNGLSSMGDTPSKKLPHSVSGLRFRGSFFGQPSQPCHRVRPVEWDEANECGMLVTGTVPGLELCRLVVIRFEQPAAIGELFKNITNIRNIFFLVGPKIENVEYLDLGRAFASIISNPAYTPIVERWNSVDTITKVVDRFVSDSVIIAPGRIDNKHLLAGDRIRKLVNMQAEKQTPTTLPHRHVHPKDRDVERNAEKANEAEGKRGSRAFSDAIADFKKRWQYYTSDFKDAWNKSIITTVVYMLCVTIVPTLTFGAIMNRGTENAFSIQSCLISQAVAGVIWSILSCQPLLVMSPTGPFLVFEMALYELCRDHELDFFEVRIYTSIFVVIFSLLVSYFNLAVLIKNVTLFTEDIFCALISMIFFKEVLGFAKEEFNKNPIGDTEFYLESYKNCSKIDSNCIPYIPNTFLVQFLMLGGSVAIFHYLRKLSGTTLFNRGLRNICNNFGGIFSVVIVTAVYLLFLSHIPISMVNISPPEGNAKTGFLFLPTALPSMETLTVASIAAPLVFVLMFVETEIPQQMALRESRKLKKGGGLHWDLPIVSICGVISSIFGLPWMCPAAVQSLAHINSLTVFKKSAPGEPAKVDHVIEQRVSGLATYIGLGLFAIFGHFLQIPSAAIFGVFFYLGYRNLEGNFMLLRIKLMSMPAKYRGDHKFLELAPSSHIHLYNFIQVNILILMFALKSNYYGGLGFPLMLVMCSFIVRKVLQLIFSQELLEALDGEEAHSEEPENESEESPTDFYQSTRIPV